MISFPDYVQGLAKDLERDERYAAFQSYSTLHRSLREFSEPDTLAFADITSSLIKKYERWLFGRGCCRNTVSLYMRLLRSICRQAAAAGMMEYTDDLFARVFTGYDSADKRAVSADIIGGLLELDLLHEPGLAFARDLFLLSFYLRGIPFIDLAHLRKNDIRNGVLYYRRSKTGQPLAVTLEPWAMEIFQRYRREDPDTVFLLPIIKRPQADDEQKQYDSALRLYNKRLHKLASLLGIKGRLTSYVARHSWATIAYHEGIPVSEISAGLSHTSEQVTYAYLESFSPDTLANVNLQVVAQVNRNAQNYSKESYFSPNTSAIAL